MWTLCSQVQASEDQAEIADKPLRTAASSSGRARFFPPVPFADGGAAPLPELGADGPALAAAPAGDDAPGPREAVFFFIAAAPRDRLQRARHGRASRRNWLTPPCKSNGKFMTGDPRSGLDRHHVTTQTHPSRTPWSFSSPSVAVSPSCIDVRKKEAKIVSETRRRRLTPRQSCAIILPYLAAELGRPLLPLRPLAWSLQRGKKRQTRVCSYDGARTNCETADLGGVHRWIRELPP